MKITSRMLNSAYSHYQNLAKEGKWKKSLSYAKNAFEIRKQIHGEESKHTAALAQNYGSNLYKLGKNKQAEKLLNIALSIKEKNQGKESPDLIPVLTSLGKAAANNKSSRSQEKYFRRMLSIAEDKFGKMSSQYASLQIKVGTSLYDTGHMSKAKKHFFSGYEKLRTELGDSSLETGIAAFHVGKYEMTNRDYKSAIKYLNQALISFDSGSATSRNELIAHAFLINAYENIGESEKATQHCLAIGRMEPMTDLQNYVPIFKKSPKYPRAALKSGSSGDVTVEFTVDENGFVVQPKMVSFNGHRAFIKSALKAAEAFRYAPAFVDDKVVATSGVQNRIIYEIRP
ncbi:MAG: TonB family protein [Candidatus Azotimanducaceae bacterium]|jgi:TonB family protein